MSANPLPPFATKGVTLVQPQALRAFGYRIVEHA